MLSQLPLDLVLHIFDALADDDDAKRDAHDSRSVSHVSRDWRTLALRTPALWTVLDARLGAAAAHEYAKRARSCRLKMRP